MAGKDIQELMKKKDAIEEEIKAHTKILEINGDVGMDGKLVDRENFPRADIDVYAVRKARNAIICLSNDHKALMKTIEQQLYHLHAEAREKGMVSQPDTDQQEKSRQMNPFATVVSVIERSPAADCGLCTGDKVVQFGSVRGDNFTGLQDIATVVQHSVQRPVRVVVLRNGSSITVSLTPQPWAGKGLLGCTLAPQPHS